MLWCLASGAPARLTGDPPERPTRAHRPPPRRASRPRAVAHAGGKPGGQARTPFHGPDRQALAPCPFVHKHRHGCRPRPQARSYPTAARDRDGRSAHCPAAVRMPPRGGLRVNHHAAGNGRGGRVRPQDEPVAARQHGGPLESQPRVRGTPAGNLRGTCRVAPSCVADHAGSSPRVPALPSCPGGTARARRGAAACADASTSRRTSTTRVAASAPGRRQDVAPLKVRHLGARHVDGHALARHRFRPACPCTCKPRTFTGRSPGMATTSASAASRPDTSVPVTTVPKPLHREHAVDGQSRRAVGRAAAEDAPPG